MTRQDAIDHGREAVRRRAWGEAFRALAAADREGALDPPDLERLAETANLLGRSAEAADLLTRAHRGFLDAGDRVAAARCAHWLAFGALNGGEPAQASGWIARAGRLLDE